MRKPYIRPMPKTWFMQNTRYRLFMIRELTSVFISGYLVFLLVWLHRVSQGPQPFEAMVQATRSPLAIVLHLLAFAAALYHSVTWFNLTPQVMPVRIGEDCVPRPIVAVAMGYLPWLVLSGLIIWGVLR